MTKKTKASWFSLWPRSRGTWIRSLGLLTVFCSMVGCGISRVISMPGESFEGPLPALNAEEGASAERLRAHVAYLAGPLKDRGHDSQKIYEQAAAYLVKNFEDLGYQPRVLPYEVSGKTAKNIVVEILGTKVPQEIVVVGAHYDATSDGPGANDNASGTAGVLELARLLQGRSFPRTLRLLAFANEEPPYFKRAAMGSLVYARECRARGDAIVGMISLETIGYFSDEKGSQDYPFPFNLFYPSRGNFIAFVGDQSSREFVRRSIASFRRLERFPSEGVAAPANTPGVSWSDHWSFWQCGYPGLMVTDTAPFRYPHYHTSQDTPDKLDYPRMGRVVWGVSKVVEDLLQGD